MRTVMYTHDLTALLRRASDCFRLTWNNRNHYREMGVYWRGKYLCAAEQGVMADETKVEDDPLAVVQGYHSKPYWRRSWPSFLKLLSQRLVKIFGMKGADVVDKLTKEAKKADFDFTDRRFEG